MKLRSINPFTNNLIEEFDEFTEEQIFNAVNKTNSSFSLWKNFGIKERSRLLDLVSGILKTNRDKYARKITEEMGKPIKEARAEIEKCAWVCNYYAENGAEMLKPEIIKSDARLSRIQYEPLGIILGIMPWNFPFWQVFRFAAPTLTAGNVILLKHASNVQGCARLIENAFREAGFPDGVFKNLCIGSHHVQNIIEHPCIKAVTLTGSESAGSIVAASAGKQIKKSVLELGGNNAFVIFDDADIDKAVDAGLAARMQNAGQSCIAAKRFLVHSKIAGEIIEKFKNKIRELHVGDPMEEHTRIGPLSSIAQASEVEDQVDASIKMGAKSEFLERRWHAMYYPVLLTKVKPGMPVFDEEVFGPVVAITEFSTDEEALALINRSIFGLGTTLFTQDMERAEKLIPQITDGAVFVNALVKSDPRLPFGGTKKSGYGRELSYYGIREFTNIKTVYFAE